MLYRIETSGRFSKVGVLPYLTEYREIQNSLNAQQLEELRSFIKNGILNTRMFSIQSLFGSSVRCWNDVPLIYLYRLAEKNQSRAAKMLGLMVISILMEESREWCCIKTDLCQRDQESNHYWLKSA